MKKQRIYLAALFLFSGAASAQSSVTLYGSVDAGINYISNIKGHSSWTMTSGVSQGNRWGFRGVEDLGGGLKTIFVLENGFSLTNGSLSQGGRLFGRQAWVALSSDKAGTLSLGRQYDMVVDFVQPLTGLIYTGYTHPFDNDNLQNAFRINNSIKYTSISYGGFKFGGLYGFSNTAGGFSDNRAWSLGGSYQNGPISLGVGYLHLNNPNDNTSGAVSGDYINVTTTGALGAEGLKTAVAREDVVAAAAAYKFDALRAALVYSHSKFQSATDRLSFDNYEANLVYRATPALWVVGEYSYTDGKLASTGAAPKYHQIQLNVDYLMSKRTDVYLTTVYQRAVGDASAAAIAPDTFGAAPPDASSSKNQLLVRVGLRNKF
ncbi:GBP family porin [Paraburkholderia sp. BL23I1N1]|uniref:porin n=1 Tax=Paraburkholderia sp. BL23I1N1 TaxID=1938802 RepID=UPI000E76BAC3|nr:porin [Paraburkholderia sp. BL23I1N1]RKE38661.1 GBP family porin [Paraburkholderia sp. BL23I1N1]